jgi:hypothetical protein
MALTADRTAAPALQAAHAFAERLGAELHLIRVLAPVGVEAPHIPADLARALHDAQRVLAAARHTRKLSDCLLPECLPGARICVRVGTFIEQVTERATELDARLLILPRGAPRLASLVTELAQRSQRAVLVPKSRASFGTLLAATDLEDSRSPVLRRAAQLGDELGATVLALHSVVALRTELSELEWNRLRLERATRDCGGVLEPIVAHAVDPTQGILQQARARRAGLIVVGTRTRPDRAAPNTAVRLLEGARYSILVAPLERH